MPGKSSDTEPRQGHNAAEAAADAGVDAEREKLLKERRARQTGKLRRSNRMVVFAAMMIAGGAVALVAIGPMQLLQVLGLGAEDRQKTSQLDLKVERVDTNHPALDFPTPEPLAVVEPKRDISAEMNKRLEEIRKELDAVNRSNTPGVSLAQVEGLLERYNAKMAQRIQEERESVDLRAEALRLEEERKHEEASKIDAERGRQLQEIKIKQRESKGVIVDESAPSIASADGVPQISEDLSANDRFLASAAALEVKTSSSRALPSTSHTIVQGTIISAVLETAIDSELPGNIRAQVMEPVFGFDGSRILLPAGTSLVGTFNNNTDIEQRRVLITWNRAITPEGKSIMLASTGTDLLGRAGTEGNVDNRYVERIGAAVLISTITALPSIIPPLTSSDRSSNGGESPLSRGGASGNINAGGRDMTNLTGTLRDQGGNILDKYLSLRPILRVPQGEEIRVFVNRDLVIR